MPLAPGLLGGNRPAIPHLIPEELAMPSTVTRSREKPHTPPAPMSLVAAPAPLPVASTTVETPVRSYAGDRWCLMIWLACAGFMVVLHVGQHVVYLLR